eukprot:9896348-Alexandrium_andersonii.AAC.1
MSASLVGSEMCIRDKLRCHMPWLRSHGSPLARQGGADTTNERVGSRLEACLLYTSDAADDM